MRFPLTMILGFLLVLTQACAGSDDTPDAGEDGCHLGCDGNIDDSVFITIFDDETGEELCCPTMLRINGTRINNTSGTADGGVVPDGCECTWEEEGRRAFIVVTEQYLTLVADNLFEIEMAGYEPWETTEYVPCVCVPHVEFTARLTPENEQ